MPDRPVGASVDADVGEQGAEKHPVTGAGTGPTAGPGPTAGTGRPTAGTGLPGWVGAFRVRAISLAGSRFVRWAFVAVTVGLGIYAVANDWHAVHASLAKIGFGTAALAMISVLVGMFALLQMFRVLLGALGSPLPAKPVAQILFVGQLGKYLPGSVWPVLAQMELGTAYQVPRRRSASASVLTMLLSLFTGILAGLVMLPFSQGAGPYWWVFLFAPVILALLYPRLLNLVLDRLLRLARRPPLEQPLTGRAIATALARGFASWVFYGLQIWLLGERLGLSGVSGLLLAVGAFAFAWSAGFLVVIAPAGAGIREIVLIALLSPAVGAPSAAAIALVSRVLMTLGDLVSAGAAAWLARRAGVVTAAGRPG